MTSTNDKVAWKKYIGEFIVLLSYSHNNEQVSHHSNNIEEQEHNEKDFFWGVLCEPQEDETYYIAPLFHLVCREDDFAYYSQFIYKIREGNIKMNYKFL